MTIINATPDRPIQLGYEGEDRVTVLRFRYGKEWLENGEGIFTVRVLRNGEKQAYNAQVIKDDRENLIIDMTVTDIELSKIGYGEMQLVYTGADFVKKSPVYKYYVSRSVDDAVDPPESDVYTQIIESLSDLRINFDELTNTVNEINGDIGDLAELTTANKLNIVESINEVNAKSSVSVDEELSETSTNPVQNMIITRKFYGVDEDIENLYTGVEYLRTEVQTKADASTVSDLSDNITHLYGDRDSLVESVSELVSDVQSKADKSYVDTELAKKVDDVQINGVGAVIDGVAQIPVMSESNYGVAKILNDTDYGIKLSTVGNVSDALTTSPASASQIKSGAASYNPITPINQHYAVFYGLANAAGRNERNSELPLGQYTDEAKTAIQTMLDVPSTNTVSALSDAVNDLDSDIQGLQTGLAEKVGDVQIDGTSVVADGVAEIPIAEYGKYGLFKISNLSGLSVANDGSLSVYRATPTEVKSGTVATHYLSPNLSNYSTFYGLAKAAGYDEKNSTLPLGTYSEEAKSAIRTMLDLQDVYEDYSSALTALGVIE